jgi:hypothetical protein
MQSQVPFVHVALSGQTWPHAPQLLGSEAVFTHWPLHRVVPVGQAQVPD